MKPLLLPLVAAATATSLSGVVVVASRYLVRYVDPVPLGFLRFGIGLAILFLVFRGWRRLHRLRRGDLVPVLAIGVVQFAGFVVLFNAALRFTTAGRAALVMAIIPFMTMLIAALRRQEAITAPKLAGVLLAGGGVAVVLGDALIPELGPADQWRGDVLMLGAALCASLYNVFARPFIWRNGPTTVLMWSMAAGVLALLPFAFAAGLPRQLAALGALEWGVALFVAAVGGAFAISLWTYALSRALPTRVAVFNALNPTVAVGLGVVFLGEPLGPRILIGLACVIAGILMANHEGSSR